MISIKKDGEKEGTVTFKATIDTKDVSERRQKALEHLAKDTAVEGFRKGKAPLDVAEKHISVEKVYDELISKLLPDLYKLILEENDIKPALQPEIKLNKAKDGEDWELEVRIPLQPTIKAPDYKKIAKKVKDEFKSSDIWVPGKSDEKAPDAESKMKNRDELINTMLMKISDKTEIVLSDIIIAYETDLRLNRLMDDVRKIGLTIDSYLKSRDLDEAKLKEQFKDDIIRTYKVELVLNEIGDKENIQIEKKEIDALFGTIEDSAMKAEAEKNAYVYSMMLRKQKIIDFLADL